MATDGRKFSWVRFGDALGDLLRLSLGERWKSLSTGLKLLLFGVKFSSLVTFLKRTRNFDEFSPFGQFRVLPDAPASWIACCLVS